VTRRASGMIGSHSTMSGIRTNLVIVGAALVVMLVLDYWLFPPLWALLLELSAAAVALTWSIGTVWKTRQAPSRVTRMSALGLLLATLGICVIVGMVHPVGRLRIAMSSRELAAAAASGMVRYERPQHIGSFDVNSVFVRDGVAGFDLGRDQDGRFQILLARIGDDGALGHWHWHRGIE
jgi:hypothetical protein